MTSSDSEIGKSAFEYFQKIASTIESRDPIKAAFCFYSIVNQTYSYAKEEDRLESKLGRMEVEAHLSYTKAVIRDCMMSEGWSLQSIMEFENKLEELRTINTGDEEC